LRKPFARPKRVWNETPFADTKRARPGPQRWTCAGARGALGVQSAQFGSPLAADQPPWRGRYGPSRPGGPILETQGVYIQDVILPQGLVVVLTRREIANQEIETFIM